MRTREVYADLGYNSATIDDPYPLFAELRRETPVRPGDLMIELGVPSFTAPADSRPKFSLFRYDDVERTLRDEVSFSSKFWDEEEREHRRASIVVMEGEEHRAWRTMLTPFFVRKALAEWHEQVIQPVAERFVEELVAAGNGADLIDYAHRFPMHMTCEIIGLDVDDADALERYQELAMRFALITTSVNPDPEQMRHNIELARAAGQELFDWIVLAVEDKRSRGATGRDLISHVIRAEFAHGRIDDADIALFIRMVVLASVGLPSRQFLNTLTLLLERPELLEAIRNDRALLQPALIEGERYEPPGLVAPRLTTRDVEIRGTQIPAGAFLLLHLGSANRDPDAYRDPETFDIHRDGPTPLTFGKGPHVCPGMNLSRNEIGAAISALLDRLPNLRLDPEQEPPRITGGAIRWPQLLPVIWD